MSSGKAISVQSGGIATLLQKSISILLVDGDPICLTIISKMLCKFGYKVITAKRATDALFITRTREDELDLVLAEAHLPDMDKYELLETMGETSKLPVVIMSANGNENDMLGGLFKGAAFYLVKPITMNDVKNLWQFAFTKKTDAMAAAERLGSISSYQDTEKQIFPLKERRSFWHAKRKDPKGIEKYEEEENDDFSVLKKPKLIWTNELHDRFLQAIRVLGIDGAHPKKILQHMNVPGLKKENISSHLQKYRISLKRDQDAIGKTIARDCSESHLAMCNFSPAVNLKGDSVQYAEVQSMTTSFWPELGSREQKNVRSCMSKPVGPNCCDSSDYIYDQYTLASNQLDCTYPGSTYAGTNNLKPAAFHQMIDSNGVEFLEGKMGSSNCVDSGFESAKKLLASFTNAEQEKQMQQQLFLHQQSAKYQEEIDHLFDMAKESTQIFLDKDFNDLF